MRWLVPLVYLVLAVATATAAVVADSAAAPGVAAIAADEGFELSSSREGTAIFTAAGIGPGDRASGAVEIAASGKPAELTLSMGDLEDTPGLGGGTLSSELRLRIAETGASSVFVYSGPLASMPPQRLGRLEPGAPRRFEFVATLPDAGPAGSQNRVQGATTSVAYTWTAGEAPEQRPGGRRPGGGTPPPGESQPDPLELAVTKVRHRIRHGRVLVWAACDRPCAIAVRGRLRARAGDERRSARVRLRAPAFRQGPQRLRIKLPRRLRRWLASDPRHERVRVKATFLARDAAGERDRVRRTLRLCSAR